MIIAIDGPAGVGKTTTARKLSKRLNIRYVDTGALFRAAAFGTNKVYGGYSETEVIEWLKDNNIELFNDGVYINGEHVGDKIRTPEVSEMASKIAVYPKVREELAKLQRGLGLAHSEGAVLEGRSTAEEVFPDADLKIYLTASVEERTLRRASQLSKKGGSIPYEDLRRDIMKRDARDSGREIFPLRPQKDSIIIDSTNMESDGVVSHIEYLYKRILE